MELFRGNINDAGRYENHIRNSGIGVASYESVTRLLLTYGVRQSLTAASNTPYISLARKISTEGIDRAIQHIPYLLDCILICLGHGNIEVADQLLEYMQTRKENSFDRDEVTRYKAYEAKILLHAERLCALSWKESAHIKGIIQKHLSRDETIADMLYKVACYTMMHNLSPHMFAHILNRYSDYVTQYIPSIFSRNAPIGEDYANILSVFYAEEHHIPHLVHHIAQRVRARKASQAEVHILLDRDDGSIAQYRDDETGNTFLHEIAHHPGLIRLALKIAEKVTSYHNHPRNYEVNPYGQKQGKTPRMIAQECGNTGLVDMFDAHRYLTRCAQKPKSRITQREPYNTTYPLSSFQNTSTVGTAEHLQPSLAHLKGGNMQTDRKRKRLLSEHEDQNRSQQKRETGHIQEEVKDRLPAEIIQKILSFNLSHMRY